MRDVTVVSAARTPFGKLGGALKDFSGVDLGSMVIKEAIDRAKIAPETIDEVYMGSAVLAGSVMVAARQMLFKVGIPGTTPSLTVDRACCSSMTCVGLGLRSILLGEAETVVSGGFESMSNTPFMIRDARWGKRLGDFTVEDILMMRNPITGTSIAVVTGEKAVEFGISREEQDQWALRSHQNYFESFKAEKYTEELMPVTITPKKGPATVFNRDEAPRTDTSLEKLAKLKTVYGSPTVTAGNAPGLNDGGSAVILMSGDKQKEMGLEALGRILSYGQAAGDPGASAYMPAHSIGKALKKAGLGVKDLKRIEINEAFAAMPLVSTKVLSEGDGELLKHLRSITNVNGGAVAIGHPTGASGARLVMTLIYELRRIGGGYGAAAICGGFGQSDAVIVKVE
ncbi:MAG: acetyl-CoA C-acyltransferase [Desulfocucumaceae bacterium]